MTEGANIRLVALDVDGVMTDGRVTYTSDGQEIKSFNIKDGAGIKRLHEAGIKTAIITGRSSPMVTRRAKELGIDHVIQGREDKLHALKELLREIGGTLADVAYMGDDLPDLAAIAAVGLGACPSDAVAEVKLQSAWISQHPGGGGCVRELCDHLVGSVSK
jgi:3-deoxy-D-manno-octulosonate 8-phosphate phosphatase (KDO 8-P phosphatase)